ncbi:hypothetical protein [Metalysinibacillus jejuensis]|uniref:hypothetical protein n=1 Tax=Metalysinibacillus jejuensis TaxID=914327 RepID=UPI000D39858C|nr:hypothetical protein [Metalysinibacillus jejuensis]
MAKKLRANDDFIYHIYIHMNDVDQFVIFSGLKLQQFVASVDPLRNLLLLKATYEDGMFNNHTQHDYIVPEDIKKFVKKANNSAELCWLDFAYERQLNDLTAREQAELLYIAHKREPISVPFFQKLQNRYVYIASTGEKVTKIYFKHLSDADMLITNVFNQLIRERENTTSFFRRRTKDAVPSITPEFLKAYRSYAKEGALFSLAKAEKAKSAYEIEVRNLAHYNFPDEIWDDLKQILKEEADDLIHIT